MSGSTIIFLVKNFSANPFLRSISKMKLKLSPSLLSTFILLSATGVTFADTASTNSSSATAGASQTTATDQQLQQKMENLTQELQKMQAQIDALSTAQTPPPSSPALAALANIRLWGYGEIYYIRPVNKTQDTTADLARAVFGIGYKFNDSTRFNSEYEIEHAIASSSDAGEFEVEQFYVDHQINQSVAVQTGLFLIPAGLLNETHEPTNFYGVQRNLIETLIIPSTWREGGVALHGDTDSGLHWSTGLTTGMNFAKWDYFTRGEAPLRATHQELSQANAQHLSQYLSLNYQGIPGYTLGASVFTGKVVKNQINVADNERVTLWEAHTRWAPGKFDFSALYARGTVSHTEEVNTQFPGAPNLIPAAFYGYYAQAAYNIWLNGDSRISPFIRAEHYNTGEKFEGVAPGFSAVPATEPPTGDTVYTVGANYYLTPSVVFKMDYQRFHTNTDSTRIDLGLGLAF
jgi:hypothetical protein